MKFHNQKINKACAPFDRERTLFVEIEILDAIKSISSFGGDDEIVREVQKKFPNLEVRGWFTTDLSEIVDELFSEALHELDEKACVQIFGQVEYTWGSVFVPKLDHRGLPMYSIGRDDDYEMYVNPCGRNEIQIIGIRSSILGEAKVPQLPLYAHEGDIMANCFYYFEIPRERKFEVMKQIATSQIAKE